MSEYDTDKYESDRSESDSEKNEDGRSETKCESVKRALKMAVRSTHQKNVMVWFRYNEYIAYHYAYMTSVVEVRELESYVEAAKDANWHAAMKEEMHAVVKIQSVGTDREAEPLGFWTGRI